MQRKEGFMGPQSTSTNHIPPYHDEHLTIDFDQQLASIDSTVMTLTRKEYDLLALLVQHAGEIIPRDALLLRVWGYGAEIRTRTLDVHVRRLRKKLGTYADQYIETIFGIGYRFQPFHAPRFFQAPVSAVLKPAIALGA
jgi:DNA-binding response OmpR family regulator